MDLSHEALPMESALGVHMGIDTDTFMFSISVKSRPITRHVLLSVASSIYDPLGFLGPISLFIKTLLQQMCKYKVGWDVDVPEECAKQIEKKCWFFYCHTALRQKKEIRAARYIILALTMRCVHAQ